MIAVRQTDTQDASAIASLAHKLWPNSKEDDLLAEIRESIDNSKKAFFVASEHDIIIGFAYSTLRMDYVEGTHSSPVGYLEGVFVLPEHRNHGIARQLLQCSEEWAKRKGCTEFASDCELTNESSYQFHLKAGFTEANKIICFTKTIGNNL